ncbi:TPA: restriction endonuclease subunit S [Vibrio vulnificus]
MNCNWIELPLGDLIELKRGYDLPKSKRCHGNIPIVSSAGISDFHADSKVQAPGVVTGRYGTIGEVFYVEENFWPLNTTLYVKDFKGNCPEFVYYLLKTFDFHKYSDKAAVPGVNRNHLHMEMVRVPSDYDCQKKIASYLSKLDKKISLNTDVNNTLEEIAQAIFKSWFVDFDPVKAKMNGEQPESMDAATASLFPEKLVESELGLIPEGWKVGTLKDIATFQNGYAFKGKDWTEEGFPVVKIGSVKPGIVDLKSCSYVAGQTVESLERFKLNIGDILVGMTGYVGETGLVPQSTVAPYLNQRVGRLTPLSQSRYELLYVIVRNTAYKQFAEAQAQGSAQANVSGKALMSYPIVIPSEKLIEKFSDLIAPMIKQKLTFSAQCEWLAQTRDTLLPKLLSGEIELETK